MPHASCWTAGVSRTRSSRELGLPLDERRADRHRRATAGRRATTTSGRSATPPRCRIRPAAASADAADRAARAAPGPARGAQRRRRARRRAGRRPFTYKTLGVFVDMGRHKAVAETLGIKWRGFPAWFAGADLPPGDDAGLQRAGCGCVTDWTVGLLFGRDAVRARPARAPAAARRERPARAERRRDDAGRRGARGRSAGAGRELSALALALVLGSAVLHAGWNALIADARDTHATTAVALLAGRLVFAPVAAA